jgi:hypothetical protein
MTQPPNVMIEMAHAFALAAAALVYVASDQVQWDQFLRAGAEAAAAQHTDFNPAALSRDDGCEAAQALLKLAEAAIRAVPPG